MINVLLICGGGAAEHDISLLSAKYIFNKLKLIPTITPYYVCIEKDGNRTDEKGKKCELRKAGELIKEGSDHCITLHYAIPCIHGYPGETGDIQSLFDMMMLPYLGAGPEASKVCFNKVTTKLWLDAIGLPHTPYLFLSDNSKSSLDKAANFFDLHQDLFIKASNQGSSIGCYHATDKNKLTPLIEDAFKLSPYVLIEKTIKARELEVAVFHYQGKVHVAGPGEVKSAQGFYSYDEKYAKDSSAKVSYEVSDLPKEINEKIKTIAVAAFEKLKLKDMARIDFFYTQEGELLINEVNTFPGHTSISLFPVLLEKSGITYEQYLQDRITSASRNL